jgi:hypothetical protein
MKKGSERERWTVPPSPSSAHFPASLSPQQRPCWETCSQHASNAPPPSASCCTPSTNACVPKRREAFVDYFAAYSALREKIDINAEAHASGTSGVAAPQPASAAATGRRRATGVEEYAAEETAQFYRAYQVLRLIASDAVGEAAKHCTDDLWSLAGYSKSGDQRSYDEGRARAKQSRRALRQAMREELGVTAPEPQPH